MSDSLRALDTRGMSRRQLISLAAMAAAVAPLSACGDDRTRQTQPAASAGGVNPDRPENATYPYAEAEKLFDSLHWPSTSVPEPKSKVTVTLAITSDANAEIRHQQFAIFLKKRHPNIEIKREVTPFADYLTKYVTQAAGGSLPDLMYSHYSWAQNFISKGVFAPLDDYASAASDFNKADFTAAARSYFESGGKLYGVPTDSAPKMLFYNKQIFSKAGIAPPDKSWTWDKLREVAVALTQGSGVTKTFGFTPMPVPFADLTTLYLLPYGARFLSADETSVLIDQPAAHDALAPWVELEIKHHAVPSLAELQALENADPFRVNRAAMAVNGSWVITALQSLPEHDRFDWGVTHLPSGPAGRFTPQVGSAYAITSKAKQRDAAWIVLNDFLSAAGHQFFRFIPPSRLSAFEATLATLKVNQQVIDDTKAAIEEYGTSDGVLKLPATQKAIDTAKPIWDRVRTAKTSLADGLKEIKERVTPVVRENA